MAVFSWAAAMAGVWAAQSWEAWRGWRRSRVVYTWAALWSTPYIPPSFLSVQTGCRTTLSPQSLFLLLLPPSGAIKSFSSPWAPASQSARGRSPEVIRPGACPGVCDTLAGLWGGGQGRRRDRCSGSSPPPAFPLFSLDLVHLCTSGIVFEKWFLGSNSNNNNK